MRTNPVAHHTMLRRTHIALTLLLFFAASPSAFAQSHFANCISRTAENATIIFHEGTTITAGGKNLEAGDEIAVIDKNGTCVGAGVWNGSSIAITVWGADQFSNIGGLEAGNELRFVVWDASEKVEYRQVTTTYAGGKPYLRTDGLYDNGAVYEVSALAATGSTATDSEEEQVYTFTLEQNFPNPVSSTTTIAYGLAQPADVKLEVFNMLGQRVEVLVDEQQAAGRQEITFDARHLPSGSYIYRIQAGEDSASRTMLVVR